MCAEPDFLSMKDEAWENWQKGEIEHAMKLGERLLESEEVNNEGRHLLCIGSYVKGDYEGALDHRKKIDTAYERWSELNDTVLDAYRHLGRYGEAESFARTQEMPAFQIEMLAKMKEHPLEVSLDELTIVPYAEHPLAVFFPAFAAEINGKKLAVHVDTGGTFLIMGPDNAKELGIEVVKGGTGYHGSTEVQLSHGTAARFQLGKALLQNVPVTVMPSLQGPQAFVIFGTNVLQQFFSTLDYPNEQLILSPPDNSELRERHLTMLEGSRIEVPFYMWGDHYMFARGAMGDNKGLNFFIDSGLVSLHPNDQGGLRQAAFSSSKEKYMAWGFSEEIVDKKVFESPQGLWLGPMEQRGLLVVLGSVGTKSFGGVRMDGLLSHAFLKNYAWTLDFSAWKYIFSAKASNPEKNPG